MMEDLERRLVRLEEVTAFQERFTQELNESLTRQQFQLDAVEKKMELALEALKQLQQASRESNGEGELPPHYL